jgi:hypothetical protein
MGVAPTAAAFNRPAISSREEAGEGIVAVAD